MMKSSPQQQTLLLFIFLFISNLSFSSSRLTEDFRVQQYHERGYQWPPSFVTPNTTGWRFLADRRFEQAEHITTGKEKYDLWLQSISSSIVQPNFTKTGWGLTRAPADLVEELRDTVWSAYEAGEYRFERDVEVITGDAPLFIDSPRLTRRALYDLLPLHEAWAGIELEPFTAYGFRLYRNDSSLYMHVDKPDTHIISCILHIDSSEDAEDWPIIIEDYEGNTNEVVLTPGDMLFYESSKCFHGRPKKFIGSWYSSIFVHYYPKDNWDRNGRELEGHYAIPEHWRDVSEEPEQHAKAHVVGTGLIEPECEGNWCLLSESVKWKGPAEDGMVITANGEMFPLYDEEEEEL
mmetsp:Transcript_6269/g.9640  ORF Transcript_6269/g.9640 Transcript_6269/m.9640 type:complete len:349 (+) Transcript_6269:98-1144(+)